MPRSIRHRLAELRRDQRGASLIEFGLFLPILATMVLGITDVAMCFSQKLTYEAAANRALEKVSVSSNQTDFSTLQAEAATAAGVSTSSVTVDSWLECNQVRQDSFAGNCDSGQEYARYVSVRVASVYTPMFNYGPLASGFANAQGNVPVSASSTLRVQ